MSDVFTLNTFRRTYNVLFRDVIRTFELHVGDAEHIARQIDDVIQIFRDAEQHRGLFPEAEFELLQTYLTQMLQSLYEARSVPDAALPAIDPEKPPSEMHRGLQVPEIAWMIVSQLDRSREGTAALAALARCRIFHGPALDALWREQFTIRNLINCMPGDLWVVETVDRVSTMRLRRPIRVEDWDRVLEYSHRVRFLRLDPYYERPGLSEVFEALRQNAPGDYLLPNLEILDWSPAHNPTQFSDIDLFLGPRITSIMLSDLTLRELPLLSTLTRRFPNLVDVRLVWSYRVSDRSDIDVAASAFVRGLQNVRSLHLSNPIDARAITHIGRLPTLETLRIIAPTAPPSCANLPRRALFGHLSFVEIWCPSDSDIEFPTSLVQSWANPTLYSFKMGRRGAMTADATETLFRAISEHCLHDALETLEIKLSGWGEQSSGDYTIPALAMQSLFPFRNLIEVTIASSWGLRLDDEAISELAAAWPFIEELHLGGEDDHAQLHQCGTLLALQAFARHCPNLHTLELSFDARRIPRRDPDSSHREELRQLQLVNFNVAHSLIWDAFRVARFISAIFVNVTELVTALEDDDIEGNLEENDDPIYAAQAECHKLWKEAEEFLSELRDIRAEEFHWGEQWSDQTAYLSPFLS